jgi:hypothetical protein
VNAHRLPYFQHLANRITANIITAIDNEDFGWAVAVRVCRSLILTGQFECFGLRIDGTDDLIHAVTLVAGGWLL